MKPHQWHPSTILYAWDRAVQSFRAASENPAPENLHTEKERSRILMRYFELCSPIETAYDCKR